MLACAGTFGGVMTADGWVAVDVVLGLICSDLADDVYFIFHLVDPGVDPVT